MVKIIRRTRCPRYAIVWLIPVLLSLSWLSVNTAPAEVSEKIERSASENSEFVSQSFESALEDERSDLASIEQRLEHWEMLKGSTLNELMAYRIQNTGHENLLLVLHTRLEILETALNNNRLALKRLSERRKDFEEVEEIAPEWIEQISDRISIVEKRMAKLKAEKNLTADNRKIHDKLNSLLAILHEKHQRGETFLKEYNQLYDQLKRTASELEETGQQLEVRLRLQKSSELFERNPHPFAGVNIEQLSSEIKTARGRTTDILEPAFWQEQWLIVQRIGGIAQVLFAAFFLVAIVARKKIKRTLQSREKRLETFGSSKRQLALIMIRRSFLLLCAVILLWLYDLFKLPHVNYHLATFLNKTIITLLVTQWWIDYFQNGLGDSGSSLLHLVQNRCVKLFQGLRVLVVTYLLVVAIFGTESVSAWIFRLVIETFLFIWSISFWRAIDKLVSKLTRQGETVSPYALHFSVRGCMYAIFGLALLIDLIGYHALAEHWVVSWAKTFALFLWAQVGWRSIQEWHHSQKLASKGQEDRNRPIAAAPVGWFLVQIARLLWLAAVFAGFLMAWAGSAFMLETLEKLISMDFSVGSMRISVKGILLAVLIFYVTHVATRIGRRFLSEKVLDARDFERGLKESIVTISSYIIWGLGILFALGVLGVNATSLAVVFGALSIGIGFGLQNIFNNFISGLILLFERPIQVGDYVDVNGLWAEVKKINVRSTIVQTFDNATVIIPNSDFISQQVTNWSFKDPRMRRHVDVGVAYGSDVELVRKTLLEIPNGISQILKDPKPDVLFLDHGESALIFRLRYWAFVDNYYSTSTEVRFAVDRCFRELGIEIAFPQLDLHIRSDPATMSSHGVVSETSGPLKPETIDTKD